MAIRQNRGGLIAQDAVPGLLQWIDTGGLIGLMALALWAFLTGQVIPRKLHQDEIADRDTTIARLLAERNRYLEIAMRSTRVAERSADALMDEKHTLEEVAQRAAEAALREAMGK